MEALRYTGIIVVFLTIFSWFYVGLRNYFMTLKAIKDFIEKENDLKQKESQLPMRDSVKVFNDRILMQTHYSDIKQMSDLYRENPKGLKRELLVSYLRAGLLSQ